MIKRKQIDSQLIQHLNNCQEVFIQIIDKYRNGLGDNLNQILIDDDIKNGVIVNSSGSYYITGLNKTNLVRLSDFINSTKKIFSLYGLSSDIYYLNEYIKKSKSTSIDYYVMKLDKNRISDTMKNTHRSNAVFRFCDEKDYAALKLLQYDYHIEEVYKSVSDYPYAYEMNAFKMLLKSRDNYALFIDNKPVSKCYINAASYDRVQLGGIFTLKEHRNKGYSFECLGNFLVNVLHRRKNLNCFQLFVKKENLPAIKLYEKLGFTTVAETTTIYYTSD